MQQLFPAGPCPGSEDISPVPYVVALPLQTLHKPSKPDGGWSHAGPPLRGTPIRLNADQVEFP
ncbi:hypothetical protein K200098A10_03930 [Flavonifractor plautii]